jgi:hypothetical protein
MKIRRAQWGATLLVLLNFHAPATTRYVSLASTNPVPPYAGWSTAAINIQDAIDASTNGELILVTNGVYQTGGRAANGLDVTNRITVTKHITVQSVNGPELTIIQGYQVPGALTGTNAVRCAYLTNGATIIGFTFTNGATGTGNYAEGGGVFCGSASDIVSNCVLVGNYVGTSRSSYSSYAGGAFSGTLFNCVIASNQAGGGSGAGQSILHNCLITRNADGDAVHGCTLTDCTIVSNEAGAGYSTLSNCVVIGNNDSGVWECTVWNSKLVYNQSQDGGGSIRSKLVNCLLISNTVSVFGGGDANSYLTNCTLAYNSAGFGDGGGTSDQLVNCILYDNMPNNGGTVLLNCCTTPLPPANSGSGNITNDPAFVNPAGGDFHLQSNSPCINSGNNAYVTSATDLDGNPRIVGGTVDIGAYEYQTPVSKISYAWLQQYALPITTNIDTSDLDGTGLTVYDDWIAGLNPTNVLSVLVILPPVPTNNPTGLIVSWQSVSNRTYFLQSSTNLGVQTAFSTIQSDIAGKTGTTSYLDTTATNNGPFFYRVGVQQ